jgi:Na+-transporting methylmalonyl-CoA/oxaloacetate decarboxylase gamma subunit
MWSEAVRVAIIGFSVVFITLLILTVSVRIMSYFCKLGKKPVAMGSAAAAGAKGVSK